MNIIQIIQKKRDGNSLQADEIEYFVREFTQGSIPDYQASALLMAIFFRGMNDAELAALTTSMINSGEQVDLAELGRIAVDKHSTGGVGDKASIPLAPAVAACGVVVPMISGRGLGHTGGTLDKLEAIPGFRTDLSIAEFLKQLTTIGCSLIGQTKEIAPADKKLYALRDVSGTVECVPLISSSIMSKKIAEGISGLVLDVKFGTGAFMSAYEDAKRLAQTMVDIGTRMNKQVVARLTNMSEPLGAMIGNSLEIIESIEILKGKDTGNLSALVVELGAEMLILAKKVSTLEEGRAQINTVLKNGQALQKFAEIIKAQGGNANIIDDYKLLPHTDKKIIFSSPRSGFVSQIDSRSLGMASVLLGGGRLSLEDKIDPRVGIEMCAQIGSRVEKDQPLCILYLGDRSEKAALEYLIKSFIISDEAPKNTLFFRDRITSTAT